MQSADIRLLPSKNISLDSSIYDQQEQGANLSLNDFNESLNVMNITTATFNELRVSSTASNDLMEEDMDQYGSFLSQQESDIEEEVEEQLPSATADAMETYTNITENIYCGTATGKSIAEESMPCECKYRPEIDNPDAACGDDNYCINRMMFMECMVDDCPCDRYCRNRRFQLRQYARVDVIRTEKKGFGLRALTDLPTNAFIMEYIGEVITNSEFIKRTKEYEADGLKHYYFMTLKTDEIIDATKKGCLARFINHSCNPNSVTQKWVVGKNMRIGIFTRRPIKAGTELTFDYKFERYGAVAQHCYCGELNCKGYIGGSLKSDNPKVPDTTLDIQQEDESDETDQESDHESDQDMSEPKAPSEQQKEDRDMAEAVTLTQKKMLRRMHRRRASEPLQDPREVQTFVKRMLDSVGKSHLVLKLLHRLELTDVESVEGKDILKKFVRLHGLKMLKFWLGEWKNDQEIVYKVLQVLSKLPLANKNGLEDCKMMEIVEKCTTHPDEHVRDLSSNLLKDWSQLKSIYRIPKRTPTELPEKPKEEPPDKPHPPRYDTSREFFDPDDDYFEYLSLAADANEISWKIEYPPRSVIPTAPRAMIDACIKNGFYGFGRPTRVIPYPYEMPSSEAIEMDMSHVKKLGIEEESISPAVSIASAKKPKLPTNWRSAYAEDGTIYYYHRINGKTQWEFPEERGSSIEGVNQSDLEDLVEKTIQDAENKKKARQSASPSVSNRPSPQTSRPEDRMDENELKKEVGKVVTKYLSSKQKNLWNGDKFLFKELARKITHHIVDRETQSSRKITNINHSIRSKIEKFIDSHGADLVLKVQKKRKHPSISKSIESPSSVISEDISRKSAKISVQENTAWEIPPSPLQADPIEEWNQNETTSPTHPPVDETIPLENNNNNASTIIDKPHTIQSKEDNYYYRRSRSPYSRYTGEYVRPGYSRYNGYNYSNYYRYPHRSPSPYYRNRYYSERKSSPYYRSNSGRGSISDDDMDRRRWD